MKYIERIANGAVIVAVAVFLMLVYRGEFSRRDAPSLPAKPRIGSTISLPGVRFPVKGVSLVLGISATGHFCSDSLPFYKQLTRQLRGKVNFIAVLPQSQAQADDFITKAGLTETQVVSDDLGNIGVYATPTLLVVDGKGTVRSSWVGVLDHSRQQELVAALSSQTAAVPGS